MSKTKRTKRIDTMVALLRGSIIGKNVPSEYSSIIGEFNELERVNNVKPRNRKNILKILHSTRALDTTLRTFLDMHGIRNPKEDFSLGIFIKKLSNHDKESLSKLNESSRKKYQKEIVDKRNAYMHKAGKYPIDDNEVNEILSEIESCVIEVLNLENKRP